MDQDQLLVIVLAIVWWLPALFAMQQLHAREGDRRVLVWRWTAIIAIPIVGPLLWFRRGRGVLDADPGRRINRR